MSSPIPSVISEASGCLQTQLYWLHDSVKERLGIVPKANNRKGTISAYQLITIHQVYSPLNTNATFIPVNITILIFILRIINSITHYTP